MKKTVIVILFLIMFFPSSAAFGHGTGIETATKMYQGKEIAVTVELLPVDFANSDNKKIKISTFDKNTQVEVLNVTYFLGLYKDEENLFREYFFSQDGQLVLDIELTTSDEIKITGEQQYAHNAYVMSGSNYSPDVSNQVLTSNTPIQITGPIFDTDGIYTFNIELRTIGNTDDWIWSLSDIISEVSVIETTYHDKKTLDGKNTEFRVKSYYDSITSFDYDPIKKLATIIMPFDWSEKNISHVNVVHDEVMFPKNFVEFLSPSYTGQVNGIDLFKSSVIIDDYTEEDSRIVHFILLNDHVKFLKNQMKKELESLPNSMTFTLTTSNEVKFPLEAMTRDEQYKVDLSWNPEVITPDTKIQFIFTLRDSTGSPIRNSSSDLVLIQNGVEIFRTSETAAIGGDFIEHTFSQDQVGPTIIRFENIDGSGMETEFVFVVSTLTPSETITIPDWVRNNAAWWSEGQIDDRTFANGIEFMIKEGIIVISATSSGEAKDDVTIPDWVRNNAAWWSEGQIDDKTFANGLQFLIKEGIISV